MAKEIYHDNLNTESPLLDSTGTPSVEATNNAQSVPTFEWDQYLTPYNETEKGEQANVEPTQKVEQEQAQKQYEALKKNIESQLREQMGVLPVEEAQAKAREELMPKPTTPLRSAQNAETETTSPKIPTIDITKYEGAPSYATDEAGAIKKVGYEDYDNVYNRVYSNIVRKAAYNSGANAKDWNTFTKGWKDWKAFGSSYQQTKLLHEYATNVTDAMLTDVSEKQMSDGMSAYFASVVDHSEEYRKRELELSQRYDNASDYNAAVAKLKKEFANKANTVTVEGAMAYFARKDEGGHTYYDINGGRIYGENNARNAVTPYVQEYNHRLRFKNDAAYREAFTQKKFGMSVGQWVKQHYDETIQPLVDDAVQKAEIWGSEGEVKYYDSWNSEYAGAGTNPAVRESAEVKAIKAKAEALRDPSFLNGILGEGFDALRTATGDLGGVAFEAQKYSSLKKAYEGKKLNAQDEYMLAVARLDQAIAEFKQDYRQDFSWADFGGGVTASLGFMVGMARDMVMFGGGAKGVAKEVVEETAKKYGWETLKETAKGVGKGLLFEAKMTPFTNTMWQNFGERRNQQYTFDGSKLLKRETNPYLDLLKAYGTTFIERGTERLGELIDFGMGAGWNAFGSRLAQSKIFNRVANSKFGRAAQWFGDFAPISATKEGLRAMRLNGLVGETAEEYLGMFLSAPIEHLGKDHYLDYIKEDYNKALSSDTFLQTLAICGGLSGFGMAVNGVGGMYNGVRIASLRNDIRKDINNISNVNLRDALYGEMHSPRPNFNKLASLSWQEVSVADATRATRAIFNSAKVQAMRGAEMEVKRLQTFMPVIAFSVNSAYRGVDMASPAPTTDVVEVHEKDAQGNTTDKIKGYVIYGDLTNTNGIVQMMNFSGQLENISAQDVVFVRKPLSDHLAEQYNLAFSDSIEKERLEEIMQNMEDRYNVDSEAREKMLQENGFSRYKVGDVVTLVSGQQATIKGNAKNGQYTAEVLSEDGKATTMLVGFESILNEQNPTMAQAQVALFQEGKMDAPIILPTTKDGRVSLDNVSDPKVIADVLPSQVGGDAKAVEILDNEIARLKGEQAKMSQSKGLDAATENDGQYIADRIEILESAKKIIAPEVQSKEEVVEERKRNQKRLDEMSTYEFSRDYRSRNMDTQIARNSLKRFVSNIETLIASNNEAIKRLKGETEAKKTELDKQLNNATSDAEVAAIREQNGLAYEEVAVAERSIADIEAENKLLEHRKAQYQQTLKDMGGNTDTKYQEGTIGADKKIFEFAEKASKILGMPVVVSENEFTSNRQNGVHRVDEDGKSVIYINPNSTEAEQGVGILAHEIVHELKTILNKKEWAKLETYIMGAAFGRKWRGSKGYQSLIDSIQAAERRSGHKEGLDDEKAREEAVAYTIQDLIFAGERGVKAMEAIFADPDTKLSEKVRTIFKNILAKIKALFSSSNDQKLQEAIKVFEESLHRVEEKKKAGYNYAKRAKKDASGKESHSLATFNDWVDDRGVTHKGTRTMFIERMNANGFSDEQKADMIARMDTAYEYMVKLQEFTDEDGNVRFDAFNEWAKTTPHYKQIGRDYVKAITSLVSNGDYPINLELTTDCIKREAFTALVNELAKRGVNMGAMRPAQIMVLQNMMQQYGIEVACKLCFVEGKRLGIVNWAETIVQDWNDALVEAGIETDEYFDFGKDGEVVVPTTPLREIERGHEQKVAWDAIFEIDLIMQGQDAKAFKAQMQKNLKAVKEYKKQRAEEWANKTKKPRNPADWKPTKDDQKHIDELMSQGVTVAQVGKNASEYREAFNRMRDAWIEKNPKKDPLSFNPTKKQWDALDKIRNREIATVKAKMVRLIMEHPEMRKKMQLKDLLGSKGLMEIRNQDGEAFADLWSIILQRFGTGTPKPIQDATPYDGEIMGLTESQFDKANKIGGARLFSFSDFDITKIFDYMQMFFDLEANKQMLQSYTKEVPAVIALGRSNAKINISTLANADVPAEVKEQYEKANADGKKALRHKMSENAGLLLDEDGNIVGINFSKEHSVKPEFAQEIFHDDTRNKDCGAIMVGDSVNHAIYSAAQDWIRMVIPFHLSGIPLAAREKADTLWYFDNTPYQSTRKRSGEEGWTKLGTADKDFEFYNDMNKEGWNMRDKAREYIAWCKARGYRPKFDWGINSDYYRAFCEQEGFTPNQQIIDMMDADTTDGVWNQYYKFLTDFTAYKPVFNEKGEMIDEIPSPQLPVKATFDFSEMERDVLFEGKDSILAHREGNIKRTQEHISELADKATAFLLGEVTEEELDLRDDVHYENYADAEKYLEAKANSLNKLPEGNKEVVNGADIIESYSISRKNEVVIDKWLSKREDFTDEIKSAFKEYIADFAPATQLAMTKWYANGVIRIPDDMPKVEQAMAIAQKAKVDALQYKSPMEIIDQFGDVFKLKAKLINPDDVPTLRNKKQVPNTDITIYELEDSEESRVNFRNLMNSHLGKDANPWCLMQAEDGVLIPKSRERWEYYSKTGYRAAFKRGKLIAFFASDNEPTWWDRMDQPHSDIPIVGAVKGDSLGRMATLLISEESGEILGYTNIHKGEGGDPYFAEWYDLDTMQHEFRYDKAEDKGEERWFYEDGSVQSYRVFEQGRDTQRVYYDTKGNITSQTERNGYLDYSSVWHDGAKTQVAISKPKKYLDIRWDGLFASELDYVAYGKREVFVFGTNVYRGESTGLQKRYAWSNGSLEWTFRNGELIRETINKDYKAALFRDRATAETKVVGKNSITTIEHLPVGSEVYYISITNSNDGQHEKVDIENIGSINDGVRTLNEGVTDALVDEIMAEVKQRLDIVDRIATEISKDAELQRKRLVILAQKYHADNVADVRSFDDATALLDKVEADFASTESYSIDRSQGEGAQESYSLVRPTNEEVTFDNFYEGTSAVFKAIDSKPNRKADYISRSGSMYWYGEDEGGKYVIRQSDHWSAIVRDADDVKAFDAKPDNYKNIASCYWALDKEEHIKQMRAERGIPYSNAKQEFGHTPNVGTQTVAVAKAYLTDFTKWEVEPRESFSILRSEDTDTIFATAKEEFESTSDWKKTGWLMPDGTQLDFAEGGDYRGTDHRAIGAAYKGVAEHQWQYLQDFESRGGIRIHMNRDGKYGTIEMTIKPTAEQKKRLRSFIGAVGGNVDVDFMDANYNTAHSASYEGVSPARVLSGITSFYDEGIKPKGNVSYSVDRYDKRTIEKGFGGIWIADKQEFVNFALAVRKSPFEKDGEGVVYTANYFYAYYRNIDGEPIPFASAYMNEDESQDVVNAIKERIKDGKGKTTRDWLDWLDEVIRSARSENDAIVGSNKDSSNTRRNGRVGGELSRKGRYYYNPSLYVKTQRTNRLDYEDIVRGEYYSRDQHYLNAVDNGDLETAQKDVIEAAEDAGYTEKVYHGTNAFGFTTFKSHRPSGAIFTTTRREVSANYAGDSYYARIRRINKGYKTPESVEDVINNARSVFNQDWRLATQEDKDIEIAKVEAEAEKILGKLGDLRVEMPEDIETAIAEIESIIYDGAYARDNEISKQTIERDYELFREARAILRDYNADNLTDKQKDYRNFLLSYEYGDAAIDVGEGLAKAVDSGDYAIVEDHSLMPIERLAEITKETHNIGSYELMGNLGDNPLIIDAKGRTWYDLNYEGLRNTDDIAEWAKENGYTSVVFEDIYDYGDRSEVKVFFNSKQLKSADPVTYDDKGNIIPLSERFNTEDADIRYSLNRDDVTIATPEMETEANPSTPNTMTEQEVVAENEAKRIINKKDISIEEIKKLLYDDETINALKKGTKGKYNQILRGAFKIMERMENANIEDNAEARKKVVDYIKNSLTATYVAIADANLASAQKDLEKLLKKKREGKNSRHEAIAKYVSDAVRLAMEDVVGVMAPYYTEDGKLKFWKGALLGRELAKDADNNYIGTTVEQAIYNLEGEISDAEVKLQEAQDKGDEVAIEEQSKIIYAKGEAIKILNEFKLAKDFALEVPRIIAEISEVRKHYKPLIDEYKAKKVSEIRALVNRYDNAKTLKGKGEAIRTLKAEYGVTMKEARDLIKYYEKKFAEYRQTKVVMNAELVNAKNMLLEQIRNLNTAIQGLDKEGRVALKKQTAERLEKEANFKKGILRSVRNPLFRDTQDWDESKDKPVKDEEGKPYSKRKQRKLKIGGTASDADLIESFEFAASKIDVFSIPDHWLHDGFYYQFVAHPTQGVIARGDWAYAQNKAIREKVDALVERCTKGKYKSVDALGKLLNKEIGRPFTIVGSDVKGEQRPNTASTKHTFTIDEMLQIRATARQEGTMPGYIVNGLTEEDVNNIIEIIETAHPELCELQDAIIGEGGIMDELYAIENPIYRELHGGRDLDHTEWYFPIKRRSASIYKDESIGEAIPTSTLGNGIGSLKRRTRNAKAMDLNAGFFGVLDDHITETIRWSAGAELLNKMNIMLKSPAFVNMMKQQGVDLEVLKNSFLRALGERLGSREKKPSGWLKVGITASKHTVAAGVALNINSAMKQLLSLAAGFSDVRELPRFLQNLAPEMLAHPKHSYKRATALVKKLLGKDKYKVSDIKAFFGLLNKEFIYTTIKWAKENIPTFAERLDSGNIGFDIMEQEGIEAWDKKVQPIITKAMFFNQFADAVCSSIVARTKYDTMYARFKARGYSDKQAHDEASMIAALHINHTQQSANKAFLSKIQADRVTGYNALAKVVLTAYNNQQLGMDREVRSATKNLSAMADSKMRNRMIAAKAEDYMAMNPNMTKKEAMKWAKRDVTSAVVTQIGNWIYAKLTAPLLWVAGTAMSAVLVNVAFAALGGDDEDKWRDLEWDKIFEEEWERFKTGWYLYLLPKSQHIAVKPTLDMLYDAAPLTQYRRVPKTESLPVPLQPIDVLVRETYNAVKAYAERDEHLYKDETEWKEKALTTSLALVDGITRYGLGLSARTMQRMIQGVISMADGVDMEDVMNVVSSPRQIVKLFVSRPRKGETMDQYTERVSGMYKMINGFNKGEDISVLRKQYVDRMDELMFVNTDFDYNKYKEEKEVAEKYIKDLVVTARYSGGKYNTDEKEGEEDIIDAMPDAEYVVHEEMATILADYRDVAKDLKAEMMWDEEGAREREMLIREQYTYIQDILKLREQLNTNRDE